MIPAIPLPDAINKFEALIKSRPIDDAAAKAELKLFHHFSLGVYMRELHIPAGMITIGAIHKYPCLSILAKGKRMTRVANHIETVAAPHIQLTEPGFKRISYTIEDAVFITVHENPTNSQDIDWLEKELSCESEQEYLRFAQKLIRSEK